ncbi:MAG: hypothetical protein ACWGOX_04935 [Desulforhopalus sp.]
MAVFSFRPPRIETALKIWLRLQEVASGQPLPYRTRATIINLSVNGACLAVTNPLFDNTHVFYSTLDSDRYALLLQFDNSDGGKEQFSITARSVWMDSCTHDGKPAFKIGICFLQEQKEIFTRIKKGGVL